MSPQRDTESGFRHLMRVRLGVHGARGRLYHCTSRRGYEFWRVKLDDHTWAWPADCVQDGVGDKVARCGDCEMRFISDGSSPLCRYCNPAAFGRPSEIRRPNAYLAGVRTPMTARTLTPEEEIASAEQRRRDEQIYPF